MLKGKLLSYNIDYQPTTSICNNTHTPQVVQIFKELKRNTSVHDSITAFMTLEIWQKPRILTLKSKFLLALRVNAYLSVFSLIFLSVTVMVTNLINKNRLPVA